MILYKLEININYIYIVSHTFFMINYQSVIIILASVQIYY